MKIKIYPAALQPATRSALTRAVCVALTSMTASTALFAQGAQTGPVVLEEVVITGTSIRGVAQPVGSNLITIGRDAIEESGATTVQQLLSSVPQVTGFGNAGQGGFGSFDGAGTFAPTLHGLGASASNGTLVLIDGRRLPLSGLNHTLADPNIIAPLSIERVEVLPDGASSTYGSDAVAGVLNFITRRNYRGSEVNASVGFGDGYSTRDAGFLWGDAWESGSALITYNYTEKSNLANADRQDIIYPDHRAQGGGNFLSTSCGPASIAASSSSAYFVSPYTGTSSPASAGQCNTSIYGDLLPETIRHNLLIKLTHDINDRLSVGANVVFSKATANAATARGNFSGTAFGAGNAATTQINPFYKVGTTGIGTSQFVRFQADELLGPGATNNAASETFFVSSNADLKLGADWLGSLGVTIGKDDSRQRQDGQLNASAALLALNGTTNSSGNLTTPSLPGTTTVVLNTPLTSANALDVWNPVATNQTSAAVRARLIDNTNLQIAHQTLNNISLKFDGPLFSLPGGDVRAAVGGEYLKYGMSQEVTRATGTGPASTNSRQILLDYDRDVTSGYAEVQVPIVGEGNAVPGIASLDVNLSGRYDRYSDFGGTSNPKLAMTWGVVRGFQVRANFARSFTAPALTSRGNQNGTTAESSYGAGPNVVLPDSFPGVSALKALNLVGTTATESGCNTNSVGCHLGVGALTGIQINGGNKDLKPQKGKTFSFGFDWKSQSISGLTASGTFWSAEYTGAITAPQAVFAANAPALAYSFVLFPVAGGATTAQLDALTAGLPQNAPRLAATYYSYSFQQKNALNLKANGIDASLGYVFDTAVGTFSANLNWAEKLKMDQQVGSGGTWFSVLNTSRFNTTFPSVKRTASLDLGWKRNEFSTNVKVNYTGGYLNWSGTTGSGNSSWALISSLGVPSGGGQPIPAYTTVNLHVGYNSSASEGMLKDLGVSLDVQNAFDKAPPFFNSPDGYDNQNGNPIGRVASIGVSKKW